MNFHLPWLLQQMVSERESTQRQNQTCAFIQKMAVKTPDSLVSRYCTARSTHGLPSAW